MSDECHECGEPVEPGAFGADGLVCRSCVEKRDGLFPAPSRRRALSPAEIDGRQPVLQSHVEHERARAEELRTALRSLHDEVVDYLAGRDLEVVHLPDASPLRRAVERARDLI